MVYSSLIESITSSGPNIWEVPAYPSEISKPKREGEKHSSLQLAVLPSPAADLSSSSGTLKASPIFFFAAVITGSNENAAFLRADGSEMNCAVDSL